MKRSPPDGLTPSHIAWDGLTLHRLSGDGRTWETWHACPVGAYDPADVYVEVEVERGDQYRLTAAGWRSTGRRPTDSAPATDDEIREAVCAEVRKLPVRR